MTEQNARIMIVMSEQKNKNSISNISIREAPVNKRYREVEDFPQASYLEWVDFIQ